MFQGSGPPQIVYVNPSGTRTTVTLPHPLKNGRDEQYDDSEVKRYTNLKGRKKSGKEFLRFLGNYNFGRIDTDTMDDVMALYNTSKIITWIPYSDFPYINYECSWRPMAMPHQGTVSRDSLIIKVESVGDVGKVPTADNMIAVVMAGRIFKINTRALRTTQS